MTSGRPPFKILTKGMTLFKVKKKKRERKVLSFPSKRDVQTPPPPAQHYPEVLKSISQLFFPFLSSGLFAFLK